MKLKLLIVILFSHLPFMVLGQTKITNTFQLFFLGGQSNMEGHGLNAELPDSLKDFSDDLLIFNGNPAPDENASGGLGKWTVLTPGHGAGFTSDGKDNHLAHKFGPELSLAKRLKELYPDQKFAFIKYARGGSSIDRNAAREYGSWDIDYEGVKGVNQFDHYLSALRDALKSQDINNDGIADELIPRGIIWMQGESDAVAEQSAINYQANLTRLMDLIRISFRVDDLPVVIGKISDSGQSENGKVWPFGELVQHAQEQFVKSDRNATIVRTTQRYSYSDPWHYDSEGYIGLGRDFADAFFRLEAKQVDF